MFIPNAFSAHTLRSELSARFPDSLSGASRAPGLIAFACEQTNKVVDRSLGLFLPTVGASTIEEPFAVEFGFDLRTERKPSKPRRLLGPLSGERSQAIDPSRKKSSRRLPPPRLSADRQALVAKELRRLRATGPVRCSSSLILTPKKGTSNLQSCFRKLRYSRLNPIAISCDATGGMQFGLPQCRRGLCRSLRGNRVARYQ